jgi:hypothetical protein
MFKRGGFLNGPVDAPFHASTRICRAAQIASDPDFTFEETISLLTAIFQSILPRGSDKAGIEARILARAVMRAFRINWTARMASS